MVICAAWSRHACSTPPALGCMLRELPMLCQGLLPTEMLAFGNGSICKWNLFGSHHGPSCLSDPSTESGKCTSITVPGIDELRKVHLSRGWSSILHQSREWQEPTSAPLSPHTYKFSFKLNLHALHCHVLPGNDQRKLCSCLLSLLHNKSFRILISFQR